MAVSNLLRSKATLHIAWVCGFTAALLYLGDLPDVLGYLAVTGMLWAVLLCCSSLRDSGAVLFQLVIQVMALLSLDRVINYPDKEYDGEYFLLFFVFLGFHLYVFARAVAGLLRIRDGAALATGDPAAAGPLIRQGIFGALTSVLAILLLYFVPVTLPATALRQWWARSLTARVPEARNVFFTKLEGEDLYGLQQGRADDGEPREYAVRFVPSAGPERYALVKRISLLFPEPCTGSMECQYPNVSAWERALFVDPPTDNPGAFYRR